MFVGLRSVIYPAPDLAESKQWFTRLLGVAPYFDEPFYVGYSVGGYELGLLPTADPSLGAETLWAVDDIDASFAALLASGATEHSPVTDVGDGIRVATVIGPGGALIGIIDNPHFTGGR